jgi:hypothetical protein
MKRRTLNLLTVLSLLLSLTAVVMAALSSLHLDQVSYSLGDGVAPEWVFTLGSARGCVRLEVEEHEYPWQQPEGEHFSASSNWFVTPADPNPTGRLGFGAGVSGYGSPDGKWVTVRAVSVPWLAVAGMTAIPVAVAARKRSRANGRRSFGVCHVCGYDLRATPDRCPECGAAALHPPVA